MGRMLWKLKEEQELTLYPESCEKKSTVTTWDAFGGSIVLRRNPDFGEAAAVKRMLVYEFENMDSFGDEGLWVPGDKLKGGRFQNWSLREKVDN